ncbi:MAG: hypothetical protein ACTSW1_08295 [Candidatus Hodarchaeales archaeon]
MDKVTSIIKGLIQYWGVYYGLLKLLTDLTPFNWDDKSIKMINEKINEGLNVKGVENWVKTSVCKKLNAEAKKISNVGVSYDASNGNVGVSLKNENLEATLIGNEFKLGFSL